MWLVGDGLTVRASSRRELEVLGGMQVIQASTVMMMINHGSNIFQ